MKKLKYSYIGIVLIVMIILSACGIGAFKQDAEVTPLPEQRPVEEISGVSISDLPEAQQLSRLLLKFYFTNRYFQETKETSYEYARDTDYELAMDNLIAVAPEYCCVPWEQYPVIKTERDDLLYGTGNEYDDPRKVQMFSTIYDGDGFEWLAENILDIPADKVESYIEELKTGTNELYYENGKIWFSTGGVGGPIPSDAVLLEAYKKGDIYYVYYKIGWNVQTFEDLYLYAAVQLKEIDGQKYWAILSASEYGYKNVDGSEVIIESESQDPVLQSIYNAYVAYLKENVKKEEARYRALFSESAEYRGISFNDITGDGMPEMFLALTEREEIGGAGAESFHIFSCINGEVVEIIEPYTVLTPVAGNIHAALFRAEGKPGLYYYGSGGDDWHKKYIYYYEFDASGKKMVLKDAYYLMTGPDYQNGIAKEVVRECTHNDAVISREEFEKRLEEVLASIDIAFLCDIDTDVPALAPDALDAMRYEDVFAFVSGMIADKETAKEVNKDTTKETEENNTENAMSEGGTPVFSEITASSVAYYEGDPGNSSYVAKSAMDGDSKTAWNEGGKGTGAGEWIKFSSRQSQHVKGLSIKAGYAKTKEVYYNNSRPKDITITFSDGQELKYRLEDMFDEYQTIVFNDEFDTDSVRIYIDSVYEGTTHEDCCITEVEFF